MIPRKVNTLYKAVAEETELSEELISDVVGFYWKAVKKELEEPDAIMIQLDHFGTFEIRKRQVEYQIKKQKRIIKFMIPSTYNKHTLMSLTVKKLERLEKLLVLIEKQEVKKKRIREIQKNGKIV